MKLQTYYLLIVNLRQFKSWCKQQIVCHSSCLKTLLIFLKHWSDILWQWKCTILLYTYTYLCKQHCNETICGKNSMQVNIHNCLKKLHYLVVTSLTVCIQWERETPQQNHTILCSTGCVSILDFIHQNTDYVDYHKILMWV